MIFISENLVRIFKKKQTKKLKMKYFFVAQNVAFHEIFYFYCIHHSNNNTNFKNFFFLYAGNFCFHKTIDFGFVFKQVNQFLYDI